MSKQSGAIAKLSFFSFLPRGNTDGCRVFNINGGFLCGNRILNHRLRSIEGAIMSWIYLLSGGLTLAVFVYLVVALFYPEKF
jgi:K+-transporting ATPase KdpF subunit